MKKRRRDFEVFPPILFAVPTVETIKSEGGSIFVAFTTKDLFKRKSANEAEKLYHELVIDGAYKLSDRALYEYNIDVDYFNIIKQYDKVNEREMVVMYITAKELGVEKINDNNNLSS